MDAHVEEVQRLWAENQKLEQEACGFALGAGMEIGLLERLYPTVFSDESLWEQLIRERDAALARAEAAEADAHQQRVERDAMFDTAESALARAERLKVELFEARAERDGLRAALQGHLDLAYRAERLEKALENIQLCRCIRDGNKFHECNCSCASVRRHAAAALREGKP